MPAVKIDTLGAIKWENFAYEHLTAGNLNKIIWLNFIIQTEDDSISIAININILGKSSLTKKIEEIIFSANWQKNFLLAKLGWIEGTAKGKRKTQPCLLVMTHRARA